MKFSVVHQNLIKGQKYFRSFFNLIDFKPEKPAKVCSEIDELRVMLTVGLTGQKRRGPVRIFGDKIFSLIGKDNLQFLKFVSF